MRFHHPESCAQTIFPEAELSEVWERLHGPIQVIDREGQAPVLVSERDPSFRQLGGSLCASEPLFGFFPGGVTLDALYQCTKMSSIAKQSASDPRGALSRATTLAAPHLSDGYSTRALTWFLPTLQEVGEVRIVIARGATHRLDDAGTWEEVGKSEAWRAKMTEPVPVLRAWGALGLFWALLLERLESGRPLRICELCGRTLEGTRRKQYCGRNENLDCYRQRRTADRRRERERPRRRKRSPK